MLCSFSWQLPVLLFLSIPTAYADWNFDPQATDNSPSSPLSDLATLPEDLAFDSAMTGERAEDISVQPSIKAKEIPYQMGLS